MTKKVVRLNETSLRKIVNETIEKHLKRILKEHEIFNTGGGENYWERPELDAMFKPGKAEILYKTKNGMTGGILKDILPYQAKRKNLKGENSLIFTFDSGDMGILISDDKETLQSFKNGWPKCPKAYLMSREGGTDWRIISTDGFAAYKTLQKFDELNNEK